MKTLTWISVKDRLPDDENEPIVVWMKGYEPCVSTLADEISENSLGKFVTHWFPIPDCDDVSD